MPACRSARRQQAGAGIAYSSRGLRLASPIIGRSLLAVLDETVDAAVKWRKEREELQIELFGFDEVRNWDVEMPDVQPFTTGQLLELERELHRPVLVRSSVG